MHGFRSDSEQNFLEQINDLLDAHLADQRYTVSDLASDLRISRVQLHRKIKKITGKSSSHHIRERKLRRAFQLLKESGKSVTEIAYEVGFNNLSYFARSFREMYHYNPSEIAKKRIS
ncbi:helix-turn-helix transcriptional regulator [Fulvivirga sedimenti]|uniref:Helix-turn-helix transcriptional regulator n=1 Tax=Fulvivirga sedimenti TaxID=2879465 RepID=A0A9X1HT95_9BACT|nr:helix-turn-helix transcriptional regulator [Fulvivirga sedimenti]MCA6075215.1 helix-turn-helix transcriptional regulator [Fulvivirga sedimenti]MCA6076392.1 helix-turn-helix transcriptional regulator [Fulvivirga sedimenti]MCA6077520.1 helix-turn-helix transcriptional regulator [Fulvivirga sedimenti]